jgi:small ligand-binding sensory domain FIST
MQTRITQGCAPIGVVHTITTAKDNLVLTLNDAPALYALMHTLDVPIDNPRSAVDKVRHTLVGLSAPDQPVLRATGALQDQAIVRHIIGLDPVRHGVALAQAIEPGMQLTFCERNAASAKADLLRVVTEIRDSLEPQGDDLTVAGQHHVAGLAAPVKRIAGAVYISCTGRGGPFFGFAHAELQIIQRALGDIPLVGFMASGEIAHRQLYGYSGVLTVFFADTNQAA